MSNSYWPRIRPDMIAFHRLQSPHFWFDVQMQPIQLGLKDAHPYVRRTAVMGVLKAYNTEQAAVRNVGPS